MEKHLGVAIIIVVLKEHKVDQEHCSQKQHLLIDRGISRECESKRVRIAVLHVKQSASSLPFRG